MTPSRRRRQGFRFAPVPHYSLTTVLAVAVPAIVSVARRRLLDG